LRGNVLADEGHGELGPGAGHVGVHGDRAVKVGLGQQTERHAIDLLNEENGAG
jgi:hypothetical protein